MEPDVVKERKERDRHEIRNPIARGFRTIAPKSSENGTGKKYCSNLGAAGQ